MAKLNRSCLILAGGLGTRLSSILNGLPKCLAIVNNKTFLEILIKDLSSKGFSEFYLSLGFKSEMVIDELSKPWASNYHIQFAVEPAPLGTGGAILFTSRFFGLDNFFVINGDTFIAGDISPFFSTVDSLHRNKSSCITIVCSNESSRYGSVLFDDNFNLVKFLEKSDEGTGFINLGLYFFNISFFSGLNIGDSFNIEDLFEKYSNRVMVKPLSADFIDIGLPSSYSKFASTYEH